MIDVINMKNNIYTLPMLFFTLKNNKMRSERKMIRSFMLIILVTQNKYKNLVDSIVKNPAAMGKINV